MFSYNAYSPTEDRNAAPARTTEATASTGLIRLRPVENQYLSVPQSREPLTLRTRRPPIDEALLESEASTNNSRHMTPSPVRPAASRHINIPQPEELPHKIPPPPGSVNCNDQPAHQKQGSGSRYRAPSPYPSPRGRATICQIPSIIITKSQPSLHAVSPHVSFPEFGELPHRTLPPLRPTNQKQSKSRVSSSSSSSASDRSRAPSPYPLSRAHRKEILQELEASRTGHRNGIHHSTAGMKGVQDIPATLDRAALPFMNPQPNLADLRSSNTRDAATSTTEDDQAQQPKQQQEQRSLQEFWDSFEDFNEHRYDSIGEIRPEYVTFEDDDVDQIPQSHYDAESTESRRRGGWFSRWFGSGRRH